MENKVRVFLADSQVIFREGMHFVLEGEEGIEVVGEGKSVEEAMAFLGRESVDILVLNEDMRDMAHRIEEVFPFVRLIFTGNFHASDEQVGEGKPVFLSKDTNPGELVAAVRKVGSGSFKPFVPVIGEIGQEKQLLREHLISLVESL